MELINLMIIMALFSLFLVFIIALYFVPSIIAYKKKHAYKELILLINFLLGWTFIGWAGTLLWSLLDADGSKTKDIFQNTKNNKYDEIEKLQKLKDSGAITEQEFEIEKAKILK